MAIYELGKNAPKLAADCWIAPNASLIGRVEMEARSSVWFDVTIRADNDRIVIGEESNVQDGSVLHTDAGIELLIGKRVTIGHKVMLHGCVVGDDSLIGIGSILLNGARIGAHSIVAAGSVVPQGKVFPDGVLLLGSPAKVIRPLNDQELQMLTFSAAHYVANAARFRRDLIAIT